MKDANTVSESRRAKSASVAFGTSFLGSVEPGEGEAEPNMRAKRASLYRQRDMLVVVVARNLAGPAETVEAGRGVRVAVRVSVRLAVV